MGDCGMRHYAWEKLACGLVDMHVYAGDPGAMPLLERVTDYASKNFNHDNRPASKDPHGSFSGSPSEWYTLAENLYRAYQATGNAKFKSFAEVWLYHSYWNKFANTSAPVDAHGVHAYSHVNTFSSAAMHYQISGDPAYLRIIRNAYDYLQKTQCYATGGFGPDERLLAPDGSLGAALEMRPQYIRDCVRVVGRLQTVPLPDAVHRRGALRRLDGTLVLQRRRGRRSPCPDAGGISITPTTGRLVG